MLLSWCIVAPLFSGSFCCSDCYSGVPCIHVIRKPVQAHSHEPDLHWSAWSGNRLCTVTQIHVTGIDGSILVEFWAFFYRVLRCDLEPLIKPGCVCPSFYRFTPVPGNRCDPKPEIKPGRVYRFSLPVHAPHRLTHHSVSWPTFKPLTPDQSLDL